MMATVTAPAGAALAVPDAVGAGAVGPYDDPPQPHAIARVKIARASLGDRTAYRYAKRMPRGVPVFTAPDAIASYRSRTRLRFSAVEAVFREVVGEGPLADPHQLRCVFLDAGRAFERAPDR